MKRLVSIFFLCLLSTGFTSNAMNQSNRNYFEILGVTQDATTEEISKAYKKLSLKYHANGTFYQSLNTEEKAQADEKFKLISRAYETLKDDSKKRNYTYYLGSAECLMGESFCSNRTYSNPSTRNNGFNNASAAQNDPFADFFNKYKGSGFQLPKCYSCNIRSGSGIGLWVCHSPCCMQEFNFCDNCVNHFATNKKGMKCPHCPKIFVVERNKSDFDLKETFKCNGSGCTKITTKQYNNPCCFLSSKISLCSTCSAKSQVQCPNCTKNIDIESKSGSVKLKKPVAMKYCSGQKCLNQIPETAKSYHNPCCYSQISLCEICVTQTQMKCPDCRGNIDIERKYGSINLKKPVAMKKCSNFSCATQIPITTRPNLNPCCGYASAISLCETCLNKSQIRCPNCTGNIDVEYKYGKVNLKKPITTKKCSNRSCNNQIPENTPFNYPECCYRQLSFCDTCLIKSHMQCPNCYEEIMANRKNGKVEFKKTIKCSACSNKIPSNTESHRNPCCYGDRIFLCKACIVKLSMQCPSCNKNINIAHRSGFVFLSKQPIAMKKCSNPSCYSQIPQDTEFDLNPCCFGDISLCRTCSFKTHISCPRCYNRVDIKRNVDGRIRFEKTIKYQPAPNGPFNEQRPNYTGSFAGSFAGKAVLLGAATTTLWYCSSAWRKYSLCNELDAIKQHANKLLEERCVYFYESSELSLNICDQFDIVQLIQKLTPYTSNTVEIENAINNFDEVISLKNSTLQVIEDSFEILTDAIDNCKKCIGSPKTSLLSAGFIAIGGLLLSKKLL